MSGKWEQMIEERCMRVPAAVMRGGLTEAVRWKDTVSDAMKLINKRGRTESEMTAMLARLSKLAEEKK